MKPIIKRSSCNANFIICGMPGTLRSDRCGAKGIKGSGLGCPDSAAVRNSERVDKRMTIILHEPHDNERG